MAPSTCAIMILGPSTVTSGFSWSPTSETYRIPTCRADPRSRNGDRSLIPPLSHRSQRAGDVSKPPAPHALNLGISDAMAILNTALKSEVMLTSVGLCSMKGEGVCGDGVCITKSALIRGWYSAHFTSCAFSLGSSVSFLRST